MRVALTGGGGFIGSHLVERLLRAGHDVLVVDRAPASRIPGARLIEADLRDPAVASEAVDRVDTVYHLAARVGIGLSFSDAPSYVEDNQLATAELLGALSARRFQGRLVLSSSMVVYGEGDYSCPEHGAVVAPARPLEDLKAGRFEPGCPKCGRKLRWERVPETNRLDPRSIYAASKVAQEHLCSIWARETGASVVALRYHNVYGRRLPINTPYAGVAALFRDRLRSGMAPLVFEDGAQMRDFVHVSDVVEANLAAASHHLDAGFEAFNVCSGTAVSILDVARALATAFGPGAAQPIVTGQFRAGDVRHVVASPVRAAQMLGFRATVELAKGMADLAGEPVPAP